ncbi:acyl-CoA dehydrogenase family protein [Streptomyces sp. NPDC091412]|uniref:acyl-CoA dehydrogenase family protein n=1 Tax=Streptomyces sp. NPDC091412 TaxID=3366002 RepID=UPI0037FC9C10
MILQDVEAAEMRSELTECVAQLADRVAPRSDAVARADAAADGAFDRELWERLIREVGILGLAVPEEQGGAGATHAELGAVVEVLGRRTAAVPLFGAALAIEALVAALESPTAGVWLPALIDGSAHGAVAFAGDLRAVEVDGVWRVTGSAPAVVDGSVTDVLIAEASTPAGARWFGVDVADATRDRHETLDLVRDITTLTVDGAPATDLGDAVTEGLRNRIEAVADLLLACEQLGVAEQSLEDAVEYAEVREQFGRVIGSFQAVKHVLADVAVEADLARSLVEHAVWAAVQSPRDLPEASAMALLAASRAAVLASGENVQVHGGIGFSWEHCAHLLFRKARSNEMILHPPAELADRVLRAEGVLA